MCSEIGQTVRMLWGSSLGAFLEDLLGGHTVPNTWEEGCPNNVREDDCRGQVVPRASLSQVGRRGRHLKE